MMTDLERFKSMESYTFDEGVAFLRICNVPEGVIRHLTVTHNRSNLHSEIHKTLRMPGTINLLKAKGYMRSKASAVPKKAEIVPNRDHSALDLDKHVPETAVLGTEESEHASETEEQGADGTSDINITREDVMTHKYTRYDQMPNDITRELYLQKEDLFHEMQQNHLKMRNVPEGEEHNEERAKYRAEVLRLDKEVKAHWKLIDAEIERFMSENKRPEKGQEETVKDSSFNISTYRSYISRATRKAKLTDEQIVELQHRVDALLSAGEQLDAETITKLRAIGIKFPI